MSVITYTEPQGKLSPDGKNFLPEHPSNISSSVWNRITVATILCGQARAYADTVKEAEILFEGGSRSSVAGCDIEFFTKPNVERVKDVVRALVGSFVDSDKTGFDTRLDKLECIEQGRCHSLWFVRLVSPYTD